MQKAIKMNSNIFKTFFISLAVIANTHFAYCQTASILPNAKTTFTDQNGKPLTSGTVDFYVPTTTTRKTTWQDSSKSVANANPVVLDGAGRALIWGDGAYRQVVKDRNGNLIWDQVTSSIGTGGSSTTTVGDGLPVGSILPNSGFVAPANYQFAYGQALSRSTYANLFAALTISTSIGCVGGSPLVNVSDTSNLSVGAVLESICVTGSPTVISKTSTSVTLSSNSTITVATTGTFFPYGNGDALTTFNVPDLRGYVVAGRCNMGGVDCSNLNSTYFSSNINNTPSGVNAKGGSQSLAVLQANLPNIAFPVNDPGHTHGGSFRMGTSTSTGNLPYAGSVDNTSFAYTTNTAFTNITVRSGGSGTPISSVQPTVTLNYVIKVLPDSNLTPTFGVGSIGGMTGVIACGSGVTCSGNTISFSFVGVNSVQGMTGNITCGTGLTCSAGSISANTTTPQVLSSRTAAAALDLSAYSIIRTLSYSTVGDGGGATFKKVGSTAFTDTVLSSSSITGGSGYTNGTYLGVPFTGGSCLNVEGVVVVSGGSVTGVNFSPSGKGTGCAAGNVITTANTNIGGTGSGFSITISTINGPFASFTDAAGNHWQYANEPSSPPNVKQFGVKCDWTKAAGDAGSTNDTQNFQGALNYAAIITPPTVDGGGVAGQTMLLPNAMCLTSAIEIPFGVHLKGQGRYSSGFKIADSLSAASHFITLCDPTNHLACFGTRISDFQIYPGSGGGNSNVSVIFSNNVQQMNAVERVFIFPGPRVCIYWDVGYGGAASVGVADTECNLNNASTNPGVIPNYGAAVQTFRDIIIESSGYTGNGISLSNSGGVVSIRGYHSEGVTTPIFFNVVSGAVQLHVEDAVGGTGCTSFVVRQGGSFANVIKVGNLMRNGCTNSINNAGTVTATDIVADTVF